MQDNKPSYKCFFVYLALILAVSISLGALVIHYQPINNDEGFFLYSARLMFSGQKPFRDFYFEKMPLFLALVGLPQKYIASGIFPGRWYAFCYHFATLVMLIYLGYRLGGQRAALICGLFFGTHLYTVIGGVLVSTYPYSLFFFTLSLLIIFSSLNPIKRWFFVFLVLNIAIQIRQLYVVAIPLFLAFAFAEKKITIKNLFLVFLGSFVLGSLWLIPFFNDISSIYHDLYSVYAVSHSSFFQYLMSKRNWFFNSIGDLFPELIFGILVFIIYLMTPKQRFWLHPHTFLAGLIILLISTTSKIFLSYSCHNLIAIPVIVLLLGISGARLFKKFPRFEIIGWVGLILLIMLSNRVTLIKYWQRSSPLNKEIGEIRQLIANNTRPKDLIIVFDVIYLVESGRDTIDGMNYSWIGINPGYSDELCQKLHLMNLNILLKNISAKIPRLIEFTDYHYYKLTEKFGMNGAAKLKKALTSNYKLLATFPDLRRPGMHRYFFISR